MTPPRDSAPVLDAPAHPHMPAAPNEPIPFEAPLPAAQPVTQPAVNPAGPGPAGRRRFLQAAGATALGGALVAAAPSAAQAQEPTPTPTVRPMRNVPGVEAAQAREVEAPVSVAYAQALAAEVRPELIALNRMGFGPRPGDLNALLALGPNSTARLQAYVDQQTNPASIDDSACDARIAAQGFTTLNKTRLKLWQDHLTKPDLPYEERIRPLWETLHVTFLRAVYSKRQLVEVLADFWHNHFNVYAWDIWGAATWVHTDRDCIRANIFGNFRNMLGDIAHSPAMLYYLDNISNTSAGPNENYARECFELHALGAENYMGVQTTVGPGGEYRHPAPTGSDGTPLL
ncbi:MAG: DUF1800 family protein, partial [Caldilineaceae bacterium]